MKELFENQNLRFNQNNHEVPLFQESFKRNIINIAYLEDKIVQLINVLELYQELTEDDLWLKIPVENFIYEISNLKNHKIY